MSDETIHLGTPMMADSPAAASASNTVSEPAAGTTVTAAPAGETAAVASSSASPGDPRKLIEAKLIEGKVIEVLQQIFDPEIPVNIYELGLIYVIDVQPDNSVLVKMTLTAPACPVAGTLPGEVETKVNAIPEVKGAKVELVWDPPWRREMMSESAILQLGF